MSINKTTSMKTKKTVTNVLVHVILAILSIIWVLPIVFVILTSLRAEPGSYVSYIIPKEFTLANYQRLFTDKSMINFPRWFMNTFVIACCSCLVATFFVLCVSYVMSRLRFKMRKKFMNIALILGMFPGFMSMIAIYYILKGIGLLETATLKHVALVIVYSGGAGLGFYIVKGFFDTIPRAIDEAAFIDGATKWDVFTKITLPLSKPMIVYTLLTAFMGPWVDYIFAKVILGNDKDAYTIAIGLWQMLEMEYIQRYYTSFYAGCVIISIPIALLFMLTQKYYVESVGGAVKG